jgi:hypothetical protein
MIIIIPDSKDNTLWLIVFSLNKLRLPYCFGQYVIFNNQVKTLTFETWNIIMNKQCTVRKEVSNK